MSHQATTSPTRHGVILWTELREEWNRRRKGYICAPLSRPPLSLAEVDALEECVGDDAGSGQFPRFRRPVGLGDMVSLLVELWGDSDGNDFSTTPDDKGCSPAMPADDKAVEAMGPEVDAFRQHLLDALAAVEAEQAADTRDEEAMQAHDDKAPEV